MCLSDIFTTYTQFAKKKKEKKNSSKFLRFCG